ncbi:MAG: O-antigen ligase family protein [bacterium]|nr:O-antigen ligase family protein [bacterium]
MERIEVFTNKFKLVFLLVIIVELLSFWANYYELINYISFFLITGVTLILSIKKISWGFWIVCTELIIGSFGQLFAINVENFNISIRLAIFLSLMIAYIYHVYKTKQIPFIKSKLWKYFIFLFIFLIIGLLLGLSNGNIAKDVFYDFNGFLYFGLIFVAFTVVKDWSQINSFLQILYASVLAMTFKTLFLVFYFSHVFDEALISLVYKWIRNTRVGEISQILDNYYRIFFQSHIWAVIAFVIVLTYLIYIKKSEIDKKNYIWSWIILVASSLNIIISFSRSFWLALFITLLLMMLFFYFKEKFRFKKLLNISAILLFVVIFDLILITGIVNIKLPLSSGSGDSVSVATLIKNRVSDSGEAAVTSRYELLDPLITKFLKNPITGSGFGTTVTYDTDDPRSKGLYTTYSFEWGYLDIIVKIGVLGLLVYLLFIYKIFKLGITALKQTFTKDAYALILGLLFSLILIITTHITTPYLNHPLGIFLIIIASAIFYINQKSETNKPTTT